MTPLVLKDLTPLVPPLVQRLLHELEWKGGKMRISMDRSREGKGALFPLCSLRTVMITKPRHKPGKQR
jgi:hypothetical protein